MKDTDQGRFADMMAGIADYYRQVNPKVERPGNRTLKIYFQSLRDYSIEQIYSAISAHLGDKIAGRFFPTIADIRRAIEGEAMTVESVIAAARLAQTPFGVLCKMQIGTWDLSHHDGPYLRQRAHECLQKLPEWRQRAASGQYTEREIKSMLRHGVNPLGPFNQDLLKPVSGKALSQRIEHIKAESDNDSIKRITHNNSKPEDIPESVKSQIADLLKSLKVPNNG